MRLVLGAHDLTAPGEPGRVECKALRAIPHAGYDGATRDDIMLVKLKCEVSCPRGLLN